MIFFFKPSNPPYSASFESTDSFCATPEKDISSHRLNNFLLNNIFLVCISLLIVQPEHYAVKQIIQKLRHNLPNNLSYTQTVQSSTQSGSVSSLATATPTSILNMIIVKTQPNIN